MIDLYTDEELISNIFAMFFKSINSTNVCENDVNENDNFSIPSHQHTSLLALTTPSPPKMLT